MEREDDLGLPSGEELVSFIEGLLVSNPLQKPSTPEPVAPRPPPQESQGEESQQIALEKEFMEAFIAVVFPTTPNAPPRAEAQRVYNGFSEWKEQSLLDIRSVKDETVEKVKIAEAALQNITLEGLAYFANSKFERFRIERGRAVPNTTEFLLATARAEYWERVGGITRAASELQGK